MKLNIIVPLLLGLLLSVGFALATDVTFHANVPGSGQVIHVGDHFQIQVLMDVASGNAIKTADFILTPDSGAHIVSATSGNLWSGATTTYNIVQPRGGYRFGETTATGTAVQGNNLLFVTLDAIADTTGSTTFTFSSLNARQGTFARTTTSTPITVDIQNSQADPCAGISCQNGGTCASGACTCINGYTGNVCQTAPPPSCTAVTATSCVGGIACPGNVATAALGCGTGQHCANNACVTDAAVCTAVSATCDQTGVACPGNTVLAVNACSGSQTCTNHQCVANGGGNAHQALCTSIDTEIEAERTSQGGASGTNPHWTPALVSRLAQHFRNLFGAQ